jgi:hypothetical protein
LCWLQAGASASGAGTVTGASVEIRILTPQKLVDPDAGLSYWVGINLPNDAFIEVGYLVYRTNQARTFWEYLPLGTASEASVGFLVEDALRKPFAIIHTPDDSSFITDLYACYVGKVGQGVVFATFVQMVTTHDRQELYCSAEM